MMNISAFSNVYRPNPLARQSHLAGEVNQPQVKTQQNIKAHVENLPAKSGETPYVGCR